MFPIEGLCGFVRYRDSVPLLLGNNNIILIIITTTLFQEDNIFGMYVSLTYGPQLQR